MQATNRVQVFREAAFERTDTDIANKIGINISLWSRYYEFLEIVLKRYEAANSAFMSGIEQQFATMTPGTKVLSEDDLREQEHSASLWLKLHLEIESFYIFAKILLDRISDTFSYYFAYPLKKSGSTHSQLTSCFGKVCTDKCLVVQPANLHSTMEVLKRRIINYRNKAIEHVSDPRLIHGTRWGSGKTAIAPRFIPPSDSDITQETGDLNELFKLLDQYIVTMLDFFEANVEKSILTRNTTA